jgi:hypothetical protein
MGFAFSFIYPFLGELITTYLLFYNDLLFH